MLPMSTLRYATSYITVPDKDRRGDNLRPRVTEISALQRMSYGIEIPASDTIGEALRAGKKRCARCCQFKEPAEFSSYKKGKGEYLRTYCKACCIEMERTRRFSKVEPSSPYPVRIG